jgi:hypothetical protein
MCAECVERPRQGLSERSARTPWGRLCKRCYERHWRSANPGAVTEYVRRYRSDPEKRERDREVSRRWKRVDFSNQDDDDLVFARAARASQPLEEGDLIVALDREGNECRGRVARVDDGMVYLDLDWTTWIDQDDAGSPYGESPERPPGNEQA